MKTCKTMVEAKKPESDSFNTLENLFHKYDSYCCPYCSSLPEILSFNDGNGMIKLKCKKHGEKTIDIKEYLQNMSKYVSTSELNFKNKCTQHKNESFIYYCTKCEESLCHTCFKEFKKKHEDHNKCLYNIESLRPSNNEILIIKNKISNYLQEKNNLLKQIKSLEDRITFYDALIYSLEKQKQNFFLNINVKHLILGEKIDLDEIVKDFHIKSGNAAIEEKKGIFDDFIKNNFLKVTEGMNQLNLLNQNFGDEFVNNLMDGMESNTIYKILQLAKKINNPKEIITFKNIQYLNLRGNNLTNINFMGGGRNFTSLEILSLNNNEITSIDVLKNIYCPLLRELYLSRNKISSIDVLKDLKIKKLQILWLSENNISSIDVLDKVEFPQLRKLGLSKNKINNIDVFNNTKFRQLYELYLNDNEFDLDTYYELIEKLSLKIKEFYY